MQKWRGLLEMELSQAQSPRPESVWDDGEAGEEGYFLMFIYHKANPPLRSARGESRLIISWYYINVHPEGDRVVYHTHDLLHIHVCA